MDEKKGKSNSSNQPDDENIGQEIDYLQVAINTLEQQLQDPKKPNEMKYSDDINKIKPFDFMIPPRICKFPSIGLHEASVSGTKDVGIDYWHENLYNLDAAVAGTEPTKSPKNSNGIVMNEDEIAKKAKNDENSVGCIDVKNIFHKPKADICVDQRAKNSKKEEEEEEEEAADFQKFEELDEKSRRILELEADIHAMIQKAEGKDSKKSFLEWLKDHDKCSDGDKRAQNGLKFRAVSVGFKISLALLELIILIPYQKYNDMKETFLILETPHEGVAQGENSVVIRRILDILGAAERVLKKNEEQVVEMISEEERQEDERRIDDIVFRLLRAIFHLEIFWTYERLPDSENSLKNAIRLMKDYITECEQELAVIETFIRDWLFFFAPDVDQDEVRQSHKYIEMDVIISQLWNEV